MPGSIVKEHPVLITDEAINQLLSIPSARDYESVRKTLSLLGIIGEAGRDYEPVYSAARPPIPCKVLYAGNYGIYYSCSVNKDESIVVFTIEDQRRDPKKRFISISEGFGNGESE